MDNESMLWDVFCQVVDNFGDIGVCWRLGSDLASRGETVRLWIDDPRALIWMAPGALEGHLNGITIHPWRNAQAPHIQQNLVPCDVLIEAFGCNIPHEYLSHAVLKQGIKGTQPVWINLEYLSAETYVQRSHLLRSPVLTGPAAGWHKTFFYPGFSSRTGGLIRERNTRGDRSAANFPVTSEWLKSHQIVWNGERVASLFCYEPAALTTLLRNWAGDTAKTLVLVTAGRAQAAALNAAAQVSDLGSVTLQYLPNLRQAEFDELLHISDLNFVRGEDSLVRAIWAGKPLVWQIYPQTDGAHIAKLDAFLDVLQAPATMRAFHHVWNATGTASRGLPQARWPAWPEMMAWNASVAELRAKLADANDLTTQLLQFIRKKR